MNQTDAPTLRSHTYIVHVFDPETAEQLLDRFEILESIALKMIELSRNPRSWRDICGGTRYR